MIVGSEGIFFIIQLVSILGTWEDSLHAYNEQAKTSIELISLNKFTITPQNVSSPNLSNRRMFLDTCKLQHLIERITLTHIGSNHGAASTNYIGTGLTRKSFVSGQAASHVGREFASIK